MATGYERKNDFMMLLRQRDIKFEDRSETMLALGFGGENYNHILVIVDFDSDGTSVHFVALEIMKVPEARMANMLLAVNKTNMNYRWIKWYISDNRDVIADCDAVIDDQSSSEECLEIVMRMAHIVDTAFPDLMREMYA